MRLFAEIVKIFHIMQYCRQCYAEYDGMLPEKVFKKDTKNFYFPVDQNGSNEGSCCNSSQC